MATEIDLNPDKPECGPRRGLTVRAVVLGVLIVAIVNVWVAYSEYVIHASRMNLSHFPLALFVSFLVVGIPVNFLLKTLNRAWAFTSDELLVVVAIGLPGAAVPASGLTGFFLGILGTPYYFASPENKWGEYMHPYIPAWIAPRDDGGAIRLFYDGLPPGIRAPWTVWIVPLFWWLLFISAVVWVTICLAVLLRRQWAQNERLAYPLVTAAREIVAGAEDSNLLPAFMRGRVFWYGFTLAFVMLGWNMLSYFWPTFPAIPLIGRWFSFGRYFPTMHTRINLFTIGFAYFAHPDVLFSIWFFFIVFVLQAGVMNRLGLSIGRIEDQWSNYDAANSWQNFGAFLFFVLGGLWMARGHLAAAVRHALRRDSTLDDSKELVSYRTALVGLALGMLYILAWLHQAGMEYRLAVLWLFATVVVFIGVSRIVAESGLIYVRGPLSAQSFAIYLVGANTVTPSSLTALAFTYTLIANGRALFAPAFAHVARLADAVRVNRRRLLAAVLVGLVVGTLVSIAITLKLGYQYGAYNFKDAPFSGLSRSVFRDTVGKMRTPFPRSWPRIAFMSIGFVGMALLTLLRLRFTWWPFHPLGFAISCTYLVRRSVFSIFIAWIMKTAIMQTGGVSLYRRSKPFFLGLLTGYAFGVAASFLVDAIWFFGDGHQIHTW